MLDSLVRVSRRVGGVADLLATEMQTASAKKLAIRVRLATRRVQSQEQRAWPQGPNFTSALGLVPTVRCVNDARNAAPEQGRPQSAVLADQTPRSSPHVSRNLTPRLRERLRLPLHSFTYS